MRATASACANLALVKYWGKRDEALILPMHGSISITLSGLSTTTSVEFREDLTEDVVTLNGAWASERATARITAWLEKLRREYDCRLYASIASVNHVPTAAGLASSASGFAALAAASVRALGLAIDDAALSRWARLGSGSACRSIYGGFVEWLPGVRADGLDSYAVPLAAASDWDVRCTVALVDPGEKKSVSSRNGMRQVVESSPFYPGWLASVEDDLHAARQAIQDRDLPQLGRVAEANALKMHATTLGANPPFTYWRPASVAVLERVWALRKEGVEAYATLDAGPSVVVLSSPSDEAVVQKALSRVPGVSDVIVCAPGPGISYGPQRSD